MATIKEFLESSESRQTSPEILEAILHQADSYRTPEDIWADPAYHEALAVWQLVTHNGTKASTDYVWGAAGSRWVEALGLIS